MAPGDPLDAHFNQFQALATKRPQEAPKEPISSIFKLGPPNGPRSFQETYFKQFQALATKRPQEAPRNTISTFSSLGHQTL